MKPDKAPEHSRLSPSKSHTWAYCTASIPFINANLDRIPPERPGPSAIEGTKAHTVAECLVLGRPTPKYATKDMLRHGKAYAEFVHQVKGPKAGVLGWGVEYRAPLYYLKSERGTVDFYANTATGLHLVDYKYGYDPVSSVENTQMAIYARSLAEAECDGMYMPELQDDSVITMTIFQPRIDADITTWRTTWKELREFTDRLITPKAASILNGDKGEFMCSEKICKYCRAMAICDKYSEGMLSDFKGEIETVVKGEDLPDVSTISDERVAAIFANSDKLTTWLKGVYKYTEERFLFGMKVPGLKLVLSKGGHRKWTDEAAAAKLLLGLKIPYDEVYPPADIVTPAQAEKLTHNHKGEAMIELQRLIFKPKGSPIVVLESDPRKACEENPLDDFAGENFSN